MKKAILGMGAALVAVAAFANDPQQDDTKVAAVDTNAAAFAKPPGARGTPCAAKACPRMRTQSLIRC